MEKRKSKKKKLNILYEDKNMIAVEKSAGTLTIATQKKETNTLYHEVSDYVKKQHPKNKVFIVHRLDKDTSGIVLFAKNEQTKKYLQEHWNDKTTVRKYIALVDGNMPKEKDTLISYLKETDTFLVYETNDQKHGKKAITHYKVLKKNKNYSLLEIEISTGRKNQIRVQLNGIGHPIVGDKKYGSKKDPFRRMMLHANYLSFKDQNTNKVIEIETKIPNYFYIKS